MHGIFYASRCRCKQILLQQCLHLTCICIVCDVGTIIRTGLGSYQFAREGIVAPSAPLANTLPRCSQASKAAFAAGSRGFVVQSEMVIDGRKHNVYTNPRRVLRQVFKKYLAYRVVSGGERPPEGPSARTDMATRVPTLNPEATLLHLRRSRTRKRDPEQATVSNPG